MSGFREKIAWSVAAALGLLVVAAFTGIIEGGSLDPDAPPGSTMKSLDEIPGSWSQALPADDGAPGPNPPAGCDSSRFECLEAFFNELVLDRETGLVWVRDAAVEPLGVTWGEATPTCQTTRFPGTEGYRLGFRLPTSEELQTLMQHFVGPPPLPPGHPFAVFTDDFYWTATSSSATTAWAFRFDGTVGTISQNELKSNVNYVWCVRGGQGYDWPN